MVNAAERKDWGEVQRLIRAGPGLSEGPCRSIRSVCHQDGTLLGTSTSHHLGDVQVDCWTHVPHHPFISSPAPVPYEAISRPTLGSYVRSFATSQRWRRHEPEGRGQWFLAQCLGGGPGRLLTSWGQTTGPWRATGQGAGARFIEGNAPRLDRPHVRLHWLAQCCGGPHQGAHRCRPAWEETGCLHVFGRNWCPLVAISD